MEDCINKVGVDLNTASKLPFWAMFLVSARPLVKNIVAYREEKTAASGTRKELLKVAKLGPKAYEQCAGFLRIPGGENLLDNTGVHPESYEAAEKLLTMLGYTEADGRPGTSKILAENQRL